MLTPEYTRSLYYGPKWYSVPGTTYILVFNTTRLVYVPPCPKTFQSLPNNIMNITDTETVLTTIDILTIYRAASWLTLGD